METYKGEVIYLLQTTSLTDAGRYHLNMRKPKLSFSLQNRIQEGFILGLLLIVVVSSWETHDSSESCHFPGNGWERTSSRLYYGLLLADTTRSSCKTPHLLALVTQGLTPFYESDISLHNRNLHFLRATAELKKFCFALGFTWPTLNVVVGFLSNHLSSNQMGTYQTHERLS